MIQEVSWKKIIDNGNEYAEEPLPKEKSEKRHYQSWEQLISHLESNKYKLKPNTFKLSIHTNKDIKQSAHINCGTEKNKYFIILQGIMD